MLYLRRFARPALVEPWLRGAATSSRTIARESAATDDLPRSLLGSDFWSCDEGAALIVSGERIGKAPCAAVRRRHVRHSAGGGGEPARGMAARQGRDATRLDAQRYSPAPRCGVAPRSSDQSPRLAWMSPYSTASRAARILRTRQGGRGRHFRGGVAMELAGDDCIANRT